MKFLLKIFLYLAIITVILFGLLCAFWYWMRCETIYVFSPNREHVITLLRRGNIQYVIDGKHGQIPDTNYVKFDVSDRGLATGFYVCWNTKNYEWEAVNNNTNILDSTLDTSRFSLTTKLPNDSSDISGAEEFYKKGKCATVVLDLKIVVPKSAKTTIEVR